MSLVLSHALFIKRYTFIILSCRRWNRMVITWVACCLLHLVKNLFLFVSAQSSKSSSFNQDFENNQEMIDCGPVGMHRKSIEAAEHLKSGGEDSGTDHPSLKDEHNNHQGGPTTSSESGQESQDGMGPSSSTGDF